MTHMAYQVGSGRRLGISGLGEPASSRVVVLCHSAPGTGSVDPDPTASADSKLRIIGIDRPGYGASEPRLEDWIGDVDDYLTRLEPTSERASGVDVVLGGVIGIGYGAFYAAALATAYPQLSRLVVVQPAAPLRRSEALDDPSFRDLDATDPMTGEASRQEVALEQAGGDGEAADHLLLADAGWGRRVRQARVPTDLVGARDDPGTAWWRRHLHRPHVHPLAASGLPGLAEGWRVALDLLAPHPDR
jgi:pimeloyl-ACP methyl ester carboxylesterase